MSEQVSSLALSLFRALLLAFYFWLNGDTLSILMASIFNLPVFVTSYLTESILNGN
jgi:hypothetical protein